jgi:hypothetical protein
MGLDSRYQKISGLSQSQIAFSESPKAYAKEGKDTAISKGLEVVTNDKIINGGGGTGDFGFNFYGYSSSSNQSVDEQFQIDNILGQYFFPPLITAIDGFLDEVESKLDLGGDLKKARIEYSSIPKGIFDFSKASRGLIRPVEYYCSEIDALIPPNDVTYKYINLNKTYFATIEGKKFVCEPRQEGTTEMLKAFPDKLRKVLLPSLNLFVPETIMGEQVTKMGGKRLRFTSTEKKVYAYRKRLGGGVAPFVDVYINNVGYHATTSEGRFLKALPVLTMCKVLQSAGVRTRIWIGEFSQYQSNMYIAPILAKEYGEPLDFNKIGVIASDSRYFRGVGQTSKGGVLYNNSVFWNNRDSKINRISSNDDDTTEGKKRKKEGQKTKDFAWGQNLVFFEDESAESMKYVKNAFKGYEKLGMVKPTQAPKDLMIYLPSPFQGTESFVNYEDENGNSLQAKNLDVNVINGERIVTNNGNPVKIVPQQEKIDLVVEYFYRGIDYVQLILTKNPKAIISQARRRVVDKNIEKGYSVTESEDKADKYLREILIGDVFKNVTYTNNDEPNPNEMQKIYQSSQEEIQSGKEKRAKLIDMINDQIVNPTYKSNQAP